jgi:hypothetical protein
VSFLWFPDHLPTDSDCHDSYVHRLRNALL